MKNLRNKMYNKALNTRLNKVRKDIKEAAECGKFMCPINAFFLNNNRDTSEYILNWLDAKGFSYKTINDKNLYIKWGRDDD